jgi:hypothetical protein
VKPRDRSVYIRQFIIDNVSKHSGDIAKFAANNFHVTPQAIQHHLNEMVANGTLAASGKTRGRRYELVPIVDHQFVIQIAPGLEEHVVWEEQLKSRLEDPDLIPANVLTIAKYGFTEMLNNVIDHSGSDRAIITCRFTAEELELRVVDAGVGIFKKIMNAMNLHDEVAAIHELVKGKLTTDPEHHSGEGVFFTSRLFDAFALISGTLHFAHSSANGDWLIEKTEANLGTGVRMRIARKSKRHVTDVFHTYASPEKHGDAFSRTHVPLMLMQYGQDNLISRSQAKRLLNRFDRFSEIILDFQGVPFIGQAFADEVFRVFANAHPGIELIPIRANPDVTGMIAHVVAPRNPEQKPPSAPPTGPAPMPPR